MPELHFIRPLFLVGVPLALLLGWRLGRTAAARSAWARACAPHLLAHLLVRQGPGRRRARIPAHWLLCAGLVIASIALAGPAFDRVQMPVHRLATARVIVLDLSQSMNAADLSPSRLARARFKVADILERTREGQTALVVFAADAFVVSPLTDDARTLSSLLSALSTDVVPVQGARLSRGLAEARALLRDTDASAGQVIVVTDSSPDPDAIEQARNLRDDGFAVSVLAVGTAEGAPVPLASGGFLRDGDALVLPALDTVALARLAAAGGGRLEPIAVGGADVDRLLAAPRPTGYRESGGAVRETERWLDRGPWLVLALLPLAALAFRRGWLLSLVVAAGLSPPAAEAAGLGQLWRDLWQRPDQQAAAALEQGNHARAAAVAPSRAWRGSAEYRGGDFPRAAESFAAAAAEPDGGVRADYNRGNALARAGKLREAIPAYERALARDPAFEDAEFNRDLVKALLERQQRQRQQQQQGNEGEQGQPQDERARNEGAPSGRSASDDGGRPDSESGPDDAKPAQDPEQAGEPGRQREEEAPAGQQQAQADAQAEQRPADRDAARPAGGDPRTELEDERRQALEQWLRRIPDDPGGLLRRKFALQHERRGGARGGGGKPW